MAAIDEGVPAPVLSGGARSSASLARRGRLRRPACSRRCASSSAATSRRTALGQMSAPTQFRRARLLRRHRRPRVQEDLPRAAGDDPARPPRRAGRRRRQGRAGRSTSCARAPRDSLEQHGGVDRRRAFAKLARAAALRRRRLQRRRRPSTRCATRSAPRSARCTTSRSRRACSPTVVERLGQVGLRATARASSSRSRSAATSPRRSALNRDAARGLPRVARSSASTTTSARSRCRTSSTSASPTRSSSRSGTATTSRACRSRWPRASASQGRGRFYEEAGAIRDVVQNHLLQVVALPGDGGAGRRRRRGDPRRAGAACCTAIAPLDAGRRRARPVPRLPRRAGRRARLAASRPSPPCGCTSTRWRWAGVPFFIRAGKCLPGDRDRGAGRAASGRRAPSSTRRRRARRTTSASGSSPDVAIALGRASKRPGEAMVGERRRAARSRSTRPATRWTPYERLLGDAMAGDADAVRARGRRRGGVAHRRPDPRRRRRRVHEYEPGTWGPAEADELMATTAAAGTRPEASAAPIRRSQSTVEGRRATRSAELGSYAEPARAHSYTPGRTGQWGAALILDTCRTVQPAFRGARRRYGPRARSAPRQRWAQHPGDRRHGYCDRRRGRARRRLDPPRRGGSRSAPDGLYTHIVSKDELLALMVNELIGTAIVEEPLPDARSRGAPPSLTARRTFRMFASYPRLLALLACRPRQGPNAARQASSWRGRRKPEAASDDMWTLLSIVNDYVLGHALRVATTGNDRPRRAISASRTRQSCRRWRRSPERRRAASPARSSSLGLQAVLDGTRRCFVSDRS